MRSLAFALLFALATSGCTTVRRWWKKDRQLDAQTLAQSRRPLARVGVVAVVDAVEGFVLIDSGPSSAPGADARLVSYTGPAPSAQLKAGTVRRRPFLIAEILEGTPRRGDEVFEASTAVARAEPR